MIEGFRVMEDRGDAWYPVVHSWDIERAVRLFVVIAKRTTNPLILVDPHDNTLVESNVSQLTDKRPTTPHNDK